MSETPVEYRYPPPRMGEHSGEVLRELLDIEEAEIARLRGRGIV